MLKLLEKYFYDECGATAVEYGIMLAFLSLWFIVGFQQFSDGTNNNLNHINNSINSTSNNLS